MYIISIDLGSTNYKSIIMEIVNDEIKLIDKQKTIIIDFSKFVYELLEKNNIKKNEIEKIIVTGTGASFLKDEFDGIEIEKINEFDAIGYGGLILSKKENGIVVSIGTGTAMVYSDLYENVHIGGTGLGGGTFVGLGGRVLKLVNDDKLINDNIPNFNMIMSYVKKGDTKKVDLTIGDINNGSIDNMNEEITAANFAAINKISNIEDFLAGILNVVLENICLLVSVYKKNLLLKNDNLNISLPIIFIGTVVTEVYVQKLLQKISQFTKDEYTFVDNAEYAIAIGAYEYYLLRLRKNI